MLTDQTQASTAVRIMNINYFHLLSARALGYASPDQATPSAQRALSTQSQYAFQPPLIIYLLYF